MKFELFIITVYAQSLWVAASQCGLETAFTNDMAGSVLSFPDPTNLASGMTAIWPVLDMFPLSEEDGTTFALFFIGFDIFPGNCSTSIHLGISATLISSDNGQTLIQKPVVYHQLGDEITIITNSTGDQIQLVAGNTVLASITVDGADLTALWAVGSGRGNATSETGFAGFQNVIFIFARTQANDAAEFESSNGLLLGLATESSVVVDVNADVSGPFRNGSIEFGFLDKC